MLQGPDAIAFGALVTAMPPVCRAEPGWADAHNLVTDALHALVDAAVRDRLDPAVDLVPPSRGQRPKRLPVVEAWLAALTAADGRFDGDPDAVGALERQLRPWAEIGTGRLGPARATFRLSEVEPRGSDERQATPCALELDACGAHHFLSAAAPALDEAGFGVLLPSWWDRRGKLGLKAAASTPTDGVVTGGRFGRDSLMDFRWQLAVGDDMLTAEELQGELPMPSPHVTSNTSLLDQVPPVDTRLRGHSLPDLLRPAYPR